MPTSPATPIHPAVPVLAGATRFVHTVQLDCSPLRLFTFVSNPSQWHRWHPATHAVRDVPPRPLVASETVVEHIKAAHRSFEATWTVTHCEPPGLWRIETTTPHGASAVTYRITAAPGGCRFERTCEFRSAGLWRLLDASLARWLLARQAAQALRNLRALEQLST